MILRTAIAIGLLGVACTAPREPTVNDAAAAEPNAANIIHGEARDEFEAHVANGDAFLLVGACEAELPVESVMVRDARGLSIEAKLNDARLALVAVAPGEYALSTAKFVDGASPSFQQVLLSKAVAETITFIGGVESTSTGKAASCPALPRRAARSFPYQFARLPLHYGAGLQN